MRGYAGIGPNAVWARGKLTTGWTHGNVYTVVRFPVIFRACAHVSGESSQRRKDENATPGDVVCSVIVYICPW